MNVIPRHPLYVDINGAGALLSAALSEQILLGMPHLTPFGLARTWLLKELGHRHWFLLARGMGMKDADFRTPDGHEAYAAISALKVDARLSAAYANAVLSIRSVIYPVSHARMESAHRLAVDGVEIGLVALQSVFVARTGSENTSIRRSVVQHFKAGNPAQDSVMTEDITALRQTREPAQAFERELTFRPCPFEEFNGAGLFYFAEYVALAGRAFCAWEGLAAASRMDRPMSFLFLGNIEPGETLRIGLHSKREQHDSSRCTIETIDGAPLAHAISANI